MNIPRLIEEQSSLAATYAEDGAMHTAGRILRETADIVEQRAKDADAFIAATQSKDDAEKFRGSGRAPIDTRGPE